MDTNHCVVLLVESSGSEASRSVATPQSGALPCFIWAMNVCRFDMTDAASPLLIVLAPFTLSYDLAALLLASKLTPGWLCISCHLRAVWSVTLVCEPKI